MPAFRARRSVFLTRSSSRLSLPQLPELFSRQINLSDIGIAGAPVRAVPPQHGRVHSRQGVQPEELEDDTQARQTDQRHSPFR